MNALHSLAVSVAWFFRTAAIAYSFPTLSAAKIHGGDSWHADAGGHSLPGSNGTRTLAAPRSVALPAFRDTRGQRTRSAEARRLAPALDQLDQHTGEAAPAFFQSRPDSRLAHARRTTALLSEIASKSASQRPGRRPARQASETIPVGPTCRGIAT